jgi:hypothetical protein
VGRLGAFMSNWLAIAMTMFLAGNGDIPRVNSLHEPPRSNPNFSSSDEIPILPTIVNAEQGQDPPGIPPEQGPSKKKSADISKNGPLQDQSKLDLIRYVSGEFGKAIKPLPAGKEGFWVYVGKPMNGDMLDRAVATHGAAVNTGDKVQITKLEFRDHQIAVDLNGGGRGKKSWKDHLHIDMGGVPTTQVSSTQDQGPPGLQPGMGSTVFLEFNRPLPDMTPEDLKALLMPLINFARERSAAVQWIDTLPPEMKKAIEVHKPVVGMDREELVAAIGKPDHKIRERDREGNDIEDWIYGHPPNKTVFVRFQGEKVTSIKQFPQ